MAVDICSRMKVNLSSGLRLPSSSSSRPPVLFNERSLREPSPVVEGKRRRSEETPWTGQVASDFVSRGHAADFGKLCVQKTSALRFTPPDFRGAQLETSHSVPPGWVGSGRQSLKGRVGFVVVAPAPQGSK